MGNIQVRAGHIDKRREDTIVIPLLAGRKTTDVAEQLPASSREFVKRVLRRFDATGEYGEITTLHEISGLHARRLMLLGCGPEQEMDLHRLRRLAGKLARALRDSGTRSAAMFLTDIEIRRVELAEKVQAIVEGLELGLYRFDAWKTQKKEPKRPELGSLVVMVNDRSRETYQRCQQAALRAQGIARGVCLARDLANQPGNVCTPEYLAEQALALQGEKLTVEVMDKATITEMGFRALLAVNQGSAKEPRFIVLRYRGAEESAAPIALVGKGLTFDAGGISIKPAAAMDEMKFDMCGAATVLGVFQAAVELGLKANLLGVIPSTENLLGAAAYKPGDVITAYNGTTIEVANTDAEGRLILADALAYAAEQNPSQIIDFATLTGACVIALGSQASGLMGNDERLLKKLVKAGNHTHDRVWQLPMYEEYQKQIDSDIADIRNIGGREAGTITAACFLSRFVGKTSWAHVDIAGTAWGKTDELHPKGATGAGVRLMLEYLHRECGLSEPEETAPEEHST